MSKIIILLMINLQKLLHPHKEWEEYNKQDDVGLLTLYQNQEIFSKQGRKSPFRLETIEQKACEHEEQKVPNLGKKPYGRSTSRKQFKSPNQSKSMTPQDLLRRGNFSTLKRRVNITSFDEQKLIILEKSQKADKKYVKVSSYDVAHMSTILNSKSLKKMSIVNELIKHKKKPLTEGCEENDNQQSKKNSIKNLEDQKKLRFSDQKQYKEAYVRGIKNLLDQNHLTSMTPSNLTEGAAKSCKNYKLINLDHIKMRRKNKDFRAVFKKELNTLSQRYRFSAEEPPIKESSSPKRRLHLEPISSEYLTSQSHTMSNDHRMDEDSKLKQIIEMFFTKPHEKKGSKPAIFS